MALAMLAYTPLSQQAFVVVDLETTGASALFDRVIEVAAIRVEAGLVQDRFETLVDPGIGVPPFISRLTGITSAMLRGRPRMDEVLPRLARFTQDGVLVAHNASFDHGFLVQAFRRAEHPWDAERLCTLRLARRLLPGLHSYKLDSLCAHLGFSYVQRHRAGPDAQATLSLLEYLLDAADGQGVEHIEQLLQLQQEPVSRRRRKGQVDEAQVASLPTGPGVYLLKDAQGHVVYVGKSVNVRQRVRQHLRPSGTACGPSQPRLRRRLPYVADVEAIETDSELEALFLESKLVKRYLPDANRLLRDFRDYPFIKLDLADPFPRLVATRERPSTGALYFGPFRSASMVARAVQFLTEQLGLRQCKDPLVPGQSACPLLELGKCLGPCVGAVSREQYRAAAAEAESLLRGDDRSLLDRAAGKRDQAAEQLRFEEAAELRDSIRDVELLIGAQQRLRAVVERNLVIVTPEARRHSARLLMVKAGRLVQEMSVPLPASSATLSTALRTAYGKAADSPVSREHVDDMLILEAWLKRRSEAAREVPVPADEPEAALPRLQAALAGLVATA